MTNPDSSAELARVGDSDADGDTRRVRYPLENGWAKAKLIRELAIAEKPQTQLAEEYGVGQSAIAMFKKRHMTEIEVARDNLADEFADLWIASKRNRLAEYQKAAEKLAEKPDARSAEVLAKLLKDVAEELGDLPTRPGVQINQANVTYQIEGVDLDNLK
jgi:hypothetical protein